MTYRFDPELAAAVPALPRIDVRDVDGIRAMVADVLAASPPHPPIGVNIADRRVRGRSGGPEVRVRTYLPEPHGQETLSVEVDSASTDSTFELPGVLYLHGGGFVAGSAEAEDVSAARIAVELQAVVVSVDYRMPPEDPYPASVEDCYSALRWMAAGSDRPPIDPQRIATYGVSAGGALAAAVALLSRDEEGPALCFQFLGMPVLDDRLDSPSMRAFTNTPLWDRGNAEASWRFYLGDAGPPGAPMVPSYAAPARAPDLSGLPPTYIYVCEFDPLRDEGIDFARRLVQAGIATELHLYPGTFHGSANIDAAVSRRMAADGLSALGRGLSRSISRG